MRFFLIEPNVIDYRISEYFFTKIKQIGVSLLSL